MKAKKLKQWFLRVVVCRLGFHDWLMDKGTIIKCNRTCKRCGKKMHSCYDMSYGDTIWLNGHYWQQVKQELETKTA